MRIEVERESYMAYSKSFYGVKILIHDAESFPQSSVTTTTIGQPGYDLTIAVIPSVIVSEPGIKSLSQKQRNCLFNDEVIEFSIAFYPTSNNLCFLLQIIPENFTNHEKIQFPILYDRMYCGHNFEQMRLSPVLLS